MELVHIIIDALVHRFDAPGNQYLPMELLGVIDADEAFQLFDQAARFFLRDELGGLHGIDQQL